MLRIKAFGGLTVHRGDDRVLGAAAQPRRMAVLAMIARAGPRGISRDRLLSTLWPDADEEQGRNALKQAVYALRRDADFRDLFVGTRELHLNPDEVVCDVTEFEELLRHEAFERAVALYDGPFLDGFRLSAVPEFEHWVEEERRALGRALAVGLDRLARAALEQGDAVAAVRWRRRLAALEPLNARFTVDLMNALLAAGDRAGALQQARIYEGLIAQELDLPPDESVIDLARRIREGTVVPAAPAPKRSRAETADPVAETPSSAPAAAPPSARHDAAPLPAFSVTVTPFTCISGGAETGHLSDGLTEEVLYALGRAHDLRVTRGTSDSARAGAVLEGSVRRSDDDVRVNARLLRARDGVVLWNERFDRRLGNALALQDHLARDIATGVDTALRREAGLPQAPSMRERADELYAQGLRAWTPQGAGLGQGLEQFREAVALDPDHARAHAGLAESYTQLAFYGFLPALRAADLVDAASQEAMRLAPDIAESHLARGTSLLWVHRRFAEGTAELVRALEIDPTFVIARARLAFVRLCHDGPAANERQVAHRAATMAGATGLSRVMYGQQLLAAREYDAAIDALHAAIDIETPSYLAYHWLAAAYVQKGMGAEAVAAAVAEASLSDRHPWALMSLVVACALAGQVRRAETLLETLKARAATGYVQSSVLGLAHAALGDLEAGMAFLEHGAGEHDPSMMMLRTFPMYDAFRGHSRYADLLRAVGWGEAD